MNQIISIFLILSFSALVVFGFAQFFGGANHDHAKCPMVFIHGGKCLWGGGFSEIVFHLKALKHFFESASMGIFSRFLLIFLWVTVVSVARQYLYVPQLFFRKRTVGRHRANKDILCWLNFLINSPPKTPFRPVL